MLKFVKPSDIMRSFNANDMNQPMSGLQFERRLGDIISGNVALGTTFKWGLEVKSAAADIQTMIIGLQDSHFLRILNITEGNPSDDDSYTLTYVFLKKTSETIQQDLDDFAYCKANVGKFQQIQLGIVSALRALQNTKDSKYPKTASYETAALMQFRDLWENPSNSQNDVFASVLLFCKQCETGNSVLSAICGTIDTIILGDDDDDESMKKELVDIINTYFPGHHQSGPSFESIVSDFLVRRRGNLSSHALKCALDLKEQCLHDASFCKNHMKMRRFLRNSRPCINVPYFSYVGNTELASEFALGRVLSPHQSTRREAIEFRNLKHRAKVHDLNRALLTGSCSLNMSFTLRQLRESFPIMYLQNSGGLRGCRCYLNAAGTNKFVSFILNGDFHESDESDDDDPTHQLDQLDQPDGQFDPFAPEGLEQLKSLLEAKPFSESFAYEVVQCGKERRFDDENYLFFIDQNVLDFILAERNRILIRNRQDRQDRQDRELTRKRKRIDKEKKESLVFIG
jgi:hypothetical protein